MTATAETTALAETVRRMLERVAPSTALVREDGLDALRHRVDTALDDEIGLAGLLVPESLGGLGGALSDAATVATELGRACAPSRFVTSTVLAGPLLADVGHAGPVGAACLVVPWSTAPGELHPRLTVVDGVVHGTVRSVAGVGDGLLVLPVTVDGETGVAIASTDAPGVRLDPVTSLDTTRPLTDVTLEGAPVQLLATGRRAIEALDAGLERAAVALAAEQVGLAAWCLATTVDHVQQRRQFGRLLGSFQALKHRLATLWIEVDSASVAAEAAATTTSDRAVLSCAAQSMCSEVALHAAEECIQMMGGIGMTWEHPAHLYLKRALVDLGALGTPEQHRQRLATLVDLPPAG
jgi:alkylation response protein AidB-like acyl-CoA dehydrogenase